MAVQVYGQWVQTAGPQGSPIRALAIDGGMVLAGTDNGVFSSKNNGNDWVETNAGLAKDTVVSLAVNGSKLFAGTLHSGIFASPDNGSSWTAVNQGLTGDPLDMSSYPQINGMAADGNNLYAYAIRSGIFLSQNGGMSWTPINSGLTSTNVFSLAVSGSDLFAGTGDGGEYSFHQTTAPPGRPSTTVYHIRRVWFTPSILLPPVTVASLREPWREGFTEPGTTVGTGLMPATVYPQTSLRRFMPTAGTSLQAPAAAVFFSLSTTALPGLRSATDCPPTMRYSASP